MSRIISARNKHASSLVAALEGLEDGEVAPIMDENEGSVISDMDTERGELAEAASDVDEAHEVIEELEDSAEGLESIALSLESTLADGGLSPQAAVFMNQAVSFHTQRLGLKRSIVPSMESFGGESTRQQATQISLESIKETLAKIWEAVKKAYFTVVAAVKAFFDRLFNVAPRLKHAAEKIKERAKEGGESGGEIELGGLGSKIAIGGKVMGNVPMSAKTTAGVFTELAKSINKAYGELPIGGAPAKSEDGHKELVSKYVALAKEHAKGVAGINKAHSSSPSNVAFVSEELAGGNMFKLEYSLPSASESLTTVLGKLLPGPSLSLVHGGGEGVKDAKVKALSKAEINEVCDAVIEVCNACIGAKAEIADAQKESDKLLAHAKIEANASDTMDQAVASAGIRGLGKRASNGIRAPYLVFKFGVEAMHPYLIVCEKSLKAHKSGDKAAKKEEAAKPAEGEKAAA